ncbi:murein DD-endopeptidase MepM/ murein hydrolase activator NlpD [Paenibacillus cellulosilyticus]|uniref:Murein DD-endopeptidase MepM/ murein hydrolase activator NlpD n=1 Tax=Paenibacillus cellulosilyticus TaxID=375489 RepID=A0A2V2Z0L3_9BACL|nr:M23 family metallopeptidase [Paenibacillus cellulosilyticus]PWW08808.1 murein DD-endopeptidase MepM/ murein hydrolase activator NlpD [Paenibacillus cellulosilyticus]QKS48360.1 peptidoglycan DD-metalloendopeptidase family protein [Paenibacillus cellulosilyticus]
MTVNKDSKPGNAGWQTVLRLYRYVRKAAVSAVKAPEGASGNRYRRVALTAALVGVVGVLAVAGGKQYVEANTVAYYNVLMNDQVVGSVDKPESVEAMLLSKAEEVKKAHPDVNMVLDTDKVSYEPASGYKAEPETEATITKLEGMLTSYATGVEVKVNGEVIGVVKDRETADRIMEKVKDKFTPQTSKDGEVTALAYSDDSDTSSERKLKKVEIIDEVDQTAVNTDPENILDETTMYQKLVVGNLTSTQYTVQEGDCVGCIAQKMDIPKQVIYDNNPWIEDDLIKVGDVLDLTVKKPAVTVRTVESVAETIATDPQVVYRTSANMKVGETKVLQQGSGGKKRLTYRLTKDNGYLVSEELIGYEILKKGTPKIVVKGTKVVQGEGSGVFAWPISSHTLSSSFGKRWGKMHEGIDLVGSSTIMAADDGVVEFAGEKSGYGNCVIINHKNGYKTLYGHMKSISVKEGEIVEKGDKIGVMGNTGHSTGTHLHFEIQKNGVVQNPLKYL